MDEKESLPCWNETQEILTDEALMNAWDAINASYDRLNGQQIKTLKGQRLQPAYPLKDKHIIPTTVESQQEQEQEQPSQPEEELGLDPSTFNSWQRDLLMHSTSDMDSNLARLKTAWFWVGYYSALAATDGPSRPA